MPPPPLHALDERVLALLRECGPIPVVGIAKAMGVNRAAARAALNRLRRHGLVFMASTTTRGNHLGYVGSAGMWEAVPEANA